MKVLVTGATGYIGRRLKVRLLEDERVDLRLFVRNVKKVREDSRRKAEIAEGSSFDRESLRTALRGIDVAYYLIHSMGATRGDFRELDRISAENFREACIEAGVRRIIYLGGLGIKECASKHLLSRIETGEILSAKPDRIQTIWFRAAMIIGSGSASFEILWNFVEKAPVMVAPSSISTLTQPIAVDDVLSYLFDAKDIDVKGNLIVDIGSEMLSFREMLQKTAAVIGVKRYIIPIPNWTLRLSSAFFINIFPVPRRMTVALLKGLKCETVKNNDNAEKYFPRIVPMSFTAAMRQAVIDIECKQVLSRWSDSSGAELCDVKDHDEISHEVLLDRRVHPLQGVSPHWVFRSIMALGGENGWFSYHFLWEIRGYLDKLIGGYGISRGRRDADHLRIGDSLDFWKVADIREDTRLLLVAQMKVPGKAWLEFHIDGNSLVQTAYFLPFGLWGYVYWYLLKPTHFLIFRDMAKNLIRRAREMELNSALRVEEPPPYCKG